MNIRVRKHVVGSSGGAGDWVLKWRSGRMAYIFGEDFTFGHFVLGLESK